MKKIRSKFIIFFTLFFISFSMQNYVYTTPTSYIKNFFSYFLPEEKYPLHRAIIQKDINKIDKFIKEEKDINTPIPNNITKKKLKEYIGLTPLHLAIIVNNNHAILKLCTPTLEDKIGINTPIGTDKNILEKHRGLTPLHLAIMHKEKNLALYSLLIKNKIDINTPIDTHKNILEKHRGLTPLHLAIMHKKDLAIKELLYLLIKDINTPIETHENILKEYRNLTPLQFAKKLNNTEAINLLKKHLEKKTQEHDVESDTNLISLKNKLVNLKESLNNLENNLKSLSGKLEELKIKLIKISS